MDYGYVLFNCAALYLLRWIVPILCWHSGKRIVLWAVWYWHTDSPGTRNGKRGYADNLLGNCHHFIDRRIYAFCLPGYSALVNARNLVPVLVFGKGSNQLGRSKSAGTCT